MYDLEADIKRHQVNGKEVITTLTEMILFGTTIPKGFTCDGASVPRLLHWFLSPFGVAIYAALVHDYQLRLAGGSRYSPRMRKLYDANFFINLRMSGVSYIRAKVAYYAVRLWSRYYVRRFKTYRSRELKDTA